MKDLKKLWPFLKKYKSPITLTLFLGVVLSGLTLATAQVVKLIIDEVFTKHNASLLKLAPLYIVGIYAVAGIVRFTHMYLLRYTGERIGFDIRQKLHQKYTEMSLDFHSGHSPGSLLSKTINDVGSIQQGLSLLADVVREPLSVIGMLGYLFYVDWKLTLFVFIAAPILVFASRSLGRSVRKYSRIQQEVWENVTLVLKETLDGMRVVKAFGLERHMKEKFGGVVDQMLSMRRKILRREEFSGPLFELLAAITFSGILYYAGYQAVNNQTTVGAFMSFVFVLGSMQGPIKKLQDAHVRLQHTVAATQRIFQILETKVSVLSPEERGKTPAPWNKNWKSIEFENVQFAYGPKKIIKGISLKVNRGEIIAIVGSSGGGKTTLVNLLPRFYDVTGGRILIDQTDIRDFQLDELRRQIGLVTQDVFLFNESIYENILGGEVQVQGKAGEAQKERVQAALTAANAEFVKKLGHNQNDGAEIIVGDRGNLLSGGEKQRISIARALYRNTPILILDEATSSLDSESEKAVQLALETLMQGRTTFVIAHRLSTIQRADRILVLSDGQIVEEGTHMELLQRQGVYHGLHQSQFT